MRVIHWATLKKHTVSGLTQQAQEFILNERALGLESDCANPKDKKEEVLSKNFTQKSWEYAKTADVHVFHTSTPPFLEQIRKKSIFLIHGTPEHCLDGETGEKGGAFSFAMNLIHDCQYSVTLHKRHLNIWKEFGERDQVKYVPSGIDLERWTIEGRKYNPVFHPTIGFMDLTRNIKSPFDVIFAIKKLYREMPEAKLELWSVQKEKQLVWMKMVAKLNIDKAIPIFRTELVSQPELVYRGMDIIISSVQYGDISRVGMEAMACGCPTIIGKGDYNASSNYELGNPDDLAEKIIKLWDKIQEDKEKESKRAREIAEKNYDVKRTTKELVKLYEELG